MALLLFLARGDGPAFLAFLRRVAWAFWLSAAVVGFTLLSVYANFNAILHSEFQEQAGWGRALYQAFLQIVSLVLPFYMGLCLSRHSDWSAMLIRVAWWSLPIPVIVGVAQLANVMGVHAVANLPYIGDAYEGGSFRVSSVSREASWFGGYICLTAALLLLDLRHAVTRLHKLACLTAVGILVILLIFGFSKSPYAAGLGEMVAAVAIVVVVRRPWRGIGLTVFGSLAITTALFLAVSLSPGFAERIAKPVADRAQAVYLLFEPLLLGNTNYTSVGTRFGMASAATAMGIANPGTGVGAGQFGYHVYKYFPIWGLNGETSTWLSNDAKAWPSPGNLYLRILAEIGLPGTVVYLVLRALIAAMVLRCILRTFSPTWWRDLAIFAVLVAMFVFDFNRDTFVNLNQWVALGMAYACIAERDGPLTDVPMGPWRIRFSFVLPFLAVLFAAPVLAVAVQPVGYVTSATLVPKGNGVTLLPNQPGAPGSKADMYSAFMLKGIRKDRFNLFRHYWASRRAAALMIDAQPDLVKAVLGIGQKPSASVLAQYLADNVTVLLADEQSTMVLRYSNPNPQRASQFLDLAIRQTDHATAMSSDRLAAEAAQLTRLATQSHIDQQSRQVLISSGAAGELQGAFENAGENSSFEYVERPDRVAKPWFQPASVVLLSFLFALLTAGFILAVRIWLNVECQARHKAPASATPIETGRIPP